METVECAVVKVEKDDEPEQQHVKDEKQDGLMIRMSSDSSGATDTVEMKRRSVINANKMLRDCISKLSQRQEVLEELIEIEHGAEAVQRIVENKRRLMMVLGFKEDDIAGVGDDGERNKNYQRVMSLLRLTNNFWKRHTGKYGGPANMMNRFKHTQGIPQKLTELRLRVIFSTGLLRRKPKKKCNRCYDLAHETKACPYKTRESRTPEVVAMIKERLQKHIQERAADPLIGKNSQKKYTKMLQRQGEPTGELEEKMDQDGDEDNDDDEGGDDDEFLS